MGNFGKLLPIFSFDETLKMAGELLDNAGEASSIAALPSARYEN